ncbi:MAG: hypothetical protein K2X32_03240 [Phycisphaerales bacterium]|nr:hypothetical protein [Phycisphaerales bacterium]
MSNRASWNNLLAGTFMLAFLVIGIAVTLVLAGLREGVTQRATYTVRFNLSDGAEGLEPGSMVKVGGRKAGKVSDLKFYRPPGSSVIAAVDVVIAIDKDVTLYRNARVYLQLPLLGSQSQINIPSTGDPALLALKDGDDGVIRPGSLVDGKLAPPAFLAQAGYGEEQSDELRLILKRGAEISDRLAKLTRRAEGELDTMLPTINQTLADLRAITGEFRNGVGKWIPVVEAALADIRGATSEALLGVQDARDVAKQIRGATGGLIKRVDSIARNVDELAQKANTELYNKVQTALTTGNTALEEFARVGAKASALTDELTPELRLSMANARLASDQLKLALIEVRRNPWRLLYQPGKREFQEELLFDSARAYASAVSNLRGASASLEQSLAAANGLNRSVDAETLNAIQSRIKDAFEEYRKAEKSFLDQLINGELPRTPTDGQK